MGVQIPSSQGSSQVSSLFLIVCTHAYVLETRKHINNSKGIQSTAVTRTCQSRLRAGKNQAVQEDGLKLVLENKHQKGQSWLICKCWKNCLCRPPWWLLLSATSQYNQRLPIDLPGVFPSLLAPSGAHATWNPFSSKQHWKTCSLTVSSLMPSQFN